MNTSTQTGRDTVPDPQHTRPEQHAGTPTSELAPVDETMETEAPREAEAPATEAPPKPRRPRGFAAMDRSLVSAIARKGGKAAHEAGTAHEFTREEAREAGRKGGQATHAKRRAKSEGQA